MPTVTPENARMPFEAHAVEPEHPAANGVGRVQLHQRLRHRAESQIEETGDKQQQQREQVDA